MIRMKELKCLYSNYKQSQNISMVFFTVRIFYYIYIDNFVTFSVLNRGKKTLIYEKKLYFHVFFPFFCWNNLNLYQFLVPNLVENSRFERWKWRHLSKGTVNSTHERQLYVILSFHRMLISEVEIGQIQSSEFSIIINWKMSIKRWNL